MSARRPSPRRARSPSAKSAREEARLRRAPRPRSSAKRSSAAGSRSIAISVPVGPSALGDQARVAAAAEGAVDRGLPRLGRQQLDQLGGEDGYVLSGHVGKGGDSARSAFRHSAAPARPSAISGAAASSSASCLAQASAFQISRYSPAPITTQGPLEAGVLDQRLGDRGCGRRSRASRRRSRRGSGGAGGARRVPKGLCGERKRSESCSNSAVVCTQTQGSKPLERTTPSESAARNRDGTVRRSLESRLCS